MKITYFLDIYDIRRHTELKTTKFRKKIRDLFFFYSPVAFELNDAVSDDRLT